jgi:type IV pilus assembly protein PilX
MTFSFIPSCQPRFSTNHMNNQRGVVLVIALIMLGVIGLTTSLAIRSVTLGDRIGNNIRTRQMAYDAAEVALRWCEEQVITRSALLPELAEIADLNPVTSVNAAWRNIANWNNATPIPLNLLVINTQGLNVQPYGAGTTPLCLAQQMSLRNEPGATLKDLDRAVQVTARGFSPDFVNRANANGQARGTEVWLQSNMVIRF